MVLKRKKKYRMTEENVAKIQCFFANGTSDSHGPLIAFRNDLTIKFYLVISMMMVGMSY